MTERVAAMLVTLAFILCAVKAPAFGADENVGETNMMDNTALQLRIRELEKEIKELHNQIKNQQYGLVWLDVPEGFEKDSENAIPILEEVKEKAIRNDDGKPTHILIEGDNYHALTCLNYTHRGKVDVIYIDPPYNTGNGDFVYKDKRKIDKFPGGEEIKLEHPRRHSAWLSFMSKRLELAKNLLSDKGVIFISIDDNEQANLKLLCDKVFGEGNFVATIPWRKRTAKADVPHFLSQDYEWVICYARDGYYAGIKKETRKYYTTPDFPNRPWRVHDLTTQRTAEERPNSFFTIVNPKNGKEYPANPNATWRVTKESFEVYKKQDRIVFPGDYDFLKISKPVLRYWKEDDEKKAGDYFGFTTVSSFLPPTVGMTQDGTKDIVEIMGSKAFGFPKPLSLISFLIGISLPNVKDITILDFFAGSGTTMHTVMKLNAEDGGKRQCILVNNNENEICEKVTYERNKRVIKGYTVAKGKKIEKVEGLGNSLKYYRTAFVGKNTADRANDDDKAELAHKAGCLLALGENTLEEIEHGKSWQIYSDGKERMTGVYFSGNTEEMGDFTARLEAFRNASCLNRVGAYFFSWDDGSSFENEFGSLKNIEIKTIPEPILEVYKTLNR